MLGVATVALLGGCPLPATVDSPNSETALRTDPRPSLSADMTKQEIKCYEAE